MEIAYLIIIGVGILGVVFGRNHGLEEDPKSIEAERIRVAKSKISIWDKK